MSNGVTAVRLNTHVSQCQERSELLVPISVYLGDVLLYVSMHVLGPEVQVLGSQTEVRIQTRSGLGVHMSLMVGRR